MPSNTNEVKVCCQRRRPRRSQLSRMNSSPLNVVSDLKPEPNLRRVSTTDGIVRRSETPWESRKKAIQRRKTLPVVLALSEPTSDEKQTTSTCPKHGSNWDNRKTALQQRVRSKSPQAQPRRPRRASFQDPRPSAPLLDSRWDSAPESPSRWKNSVRRSVSCSPTHNRIRRQNSLEQSPKLPRRQNSNEQESSTNTQVSSPFKKSCPSLDVSYSDCGTQLKSLKRLVVHSALPREKIAHSA